jgi:A/G-specific adenine glycosylase
VSLAVPVRPTRRAGVRRALLAWWDAGHRQLPWRFPQGCADPYRVWLAETMLQQTQVAAAVPYYRRFLERLPTLEALADASEDEVLALWSGLGYYGRARRLREAARVALARHGGLPASVEALSALPGFGPYTVGAVASIAFALPEPCVDGNVARVLSRLFLVEGPPEASATRERLWALARALVPAARPGDFNQALMDLGATVCTKPAPRCGACPVASCCAARRAGREREVPPARVRPSRPRLTMACALVERGDAVLVERRAGAGLFGGLWELPGVVVPSGADPRVALARSLLERGLPVRVSEEVARVERTLTHRRLVLTAYRCRLALRPGGAAPRLAGRPFERPGDGAPRAMATAMRMLVEAVRSAGPATAGARSLARGRSSASSTRAPAGVVGVGETS